ncbi:hypothetical protein SAMN05421810_11613 [Amycolatopsis arida]|uniref:Uncharacterized protein n=1 Tax=Amycolatopsis arida TaxID=587909 RepID=A0A1I6AYI0_9PSEU|nr:hypothetical protein CLV69_11813 [Amycolatopsis arida]SFQ73768.1 hypothetical protein SAMN05421810_11613 [Amycolatopsis arida]
MAAMSRAPPAHVRCPFGPPSRFPVSLWGAEPPTPPTVRAPHPGRALVALVVNQRFPWSLRSLGSLAGATRGVGGLGGCVGRGVCVLGVGVFLGASLAGLACWGRAWGRWARMGASPHVSGRRELRSGRRVLRWPGAGVAWLLVSPRGLRVPRRSPRPAFGSHPVEAPPHARPLAGNTRVGTRPAPRVASSSHSPSPPRSEAAVRSAVPCQGTLSRLDTVPTTVNTIRLRGGDHTGTGWDHTWDEVRTAPPAEVGTTPGTGWGAGTWGVVAGAGGTEVVAGADLMAWWAGLGLW